MSWLACGCLKSFFTFPFDFLCRIGRFALVQLLLKAVLPRGTICPLAPSRHPVQLSLLFLFRWTSWVMSFTSVILDHILSYRVSRSVAERCPSREERQLLKRRTGRNIAFGFACLRRGLRKARITIIMGCLDGSFNISLRQ